LKGELDLHDHISLISDKIHSVDTARWALDYLL